MPIDLTSVLGAPGAPVSAPAPISPPAETPPATETPAAPDEGSIPEDVLAIPEMAALLQGKPPAVWVERGDQSPEVQTVMQNRKSLEDAGFGFFGAKDGQTVAFFNQQFVSPEQLAAADNKGKLRDFATPFSELKASLGSVTGATTPPDASGASAAAPASSPALPAPAPAGVSKKLTTARLQNLAVGSPTSGQAPGQGRILNSILSPVV